MNISLPTIKILSTLFTIVLVSYLTLTFIGDNTQIYTSKVQPAELGDLMKILKDVLNNAYYDQKQHIVKIINLGKVKIRLIDFFLNFSLTTSNERFGWKMKSIAICFSDCSIEQSNLYSIGKNPVKENNLTLIPTINIFINTTYINQFKIYDIFITHLTSNQTLLVGEGKMKIEIIKYYDKITRFFLNKTTLNFAINENIFYTYNIDKNSIVNYNLIKILIFIKQYYG